MMWDISPCSAQTGEPRASRLKTLGRSARSRAEEPRSSSSMTLGKQPTDTWEDNQLECASPHQPDV